MVVGFIATSLTSYFVARDSITTQISEQTLPLTSDTLAGPLIVASPSVVTLTPICPGPIETPLLMGAIELQPREGAPTARAFEAFLKCYDKGVLIRTTGSGISRSATSITAFQNSTWPSR